MSSNGRWVKRTVVEETEGVRVECVRRLYVEGTPRCQLCEDYGEWEADDGTVKPCPSCATLTRESEDAQAEYAAWFDQRHYDC
jgi:hypothetical protein